MKAEIYCSRCKTTDGKFLKYAKSKYGHQYYYCRGCNRDKLREYRSTPSGAQATRKAGKLSTEKYRAKQTARVLLNYHVKAGHIEKPKECSICHSTERRICGHHTDYSKPCEVTWMCDGCHADIHRPVIVDLQ